MFRVAKAVAQILGTTLVILGLFAFVPNPIIGVDGYFGSDAPHNGIHIGLGLILLAASAKGEQSSTLALYLVFAILSLFAFLGIAYAQRLGSHIGMDLTMGWKPASRWKIELFGVLVTIAIISVLGSNASVLAKLLWVVIILALLSNRLQRR